MTATATKVRAVAPRAIELKAADLCDRCPAAAKAVASLPSGGWLLLCGHHTREHAAGLVASGATVDTVDTF